LANFGEKVEFVTRLPKNDLGDACLINLRGYGVGTDHIERGGNRMGIYFLEAGAAQRGSNVIYDRANSGFATIEPGMIDWKKAFDSADWFHWTGITPAVSRSAADACREAVQLARDMDLIISCDLNYRAKLWKWGSDARDVMPELISMCDVALVNEDAVDKMLDIRVPETDSVEFNNSRGLCEELSGKFPALKTIAVSLRDSHSASRNLWSGILWKDGILYSAPAYDILPIIDRVGGGDAFMAGLIYGLRNYKDDPQRTINFATAAGCLKHSIAGDFNIVTVGEVEVLMNGDSSGRVSR
jgi:2-dehydro-3-deoxygluconokinase